MLSVVRRQETLQQLARVRIDTAPEGGKLPRKKKRRRGQLSLTKNWDALAGTKVVSNGDGSAIVIVLDSDAMSEQLDSIEATMDKGFDKTLSTIIESYVLMRESMQALNDKVNQQQRVVAWLMCLCLMNAILPAGWLIVAIDNFVEVLMTLWGAIFPGL